MFVRGAEQAPGQHQRDAEKAEFFFKRVAEQAPTCQDRLREAQWQRDETSRELAKVTAQKDKLHKDSCEKSERHLESLKDLHKRAVVSERDLESKTQQVARLSDMHKMALKAYSQLAKEVEAWPVLTKFEKSR